MPLFKKKPVVVEAHQWFENGDHPEDDSKKITAPSGEEFLTEGKIVRYFRNPEMSGEQFCGYCDRIMHEHGWIDTLEGGHTVCPGDWVIKGIVGEFYPCKPAIFEATYEAVEGE